MLELLVEEQQDALMPLSFVEAELIGRSARFGQCVELGGGVASEEVARNVEYLFFDMGGAKRWCHVLAAMCVGKLTYLG
jgi:hypothetical protein